MTRLYPRGRGTKDSSASFSSSLCSRFVKNDNKQLGKIYEKRKTGLVTPPPSLVHYSKKGTYPGNPVPPNQAGQTPDPGQVLGSLKGDPFFAHLELLEGRFRDFFPFFPSPPSRRVSAAAKQQAASKDLGVEFRKNRW